MKRLLIVILTLGLPSAAATKVLLHDSSSAISIGPAYLVKRANSNQGTTKVTAITNTIAGDIAGQYWPSSTAGHIITKTAGGTIVVWLSDPIASISGAIAGTITPNLWGLESAAAANAGFSFEVWRWTNAGGVVSKVATSAANSAAEWGTSAAVRTAPATTPVSTTFQAGDRMLIIIYNDDPSGCPGTCEAAGGRTWTLDYDAGTGVDGDTYLSFTETITFSSDTYNYTPNRGMTQ